MYVENFDKDWQFRRGFIDSIGGLESEPFTLANLPHDGMISTKVSKDAPAKYDSGYFLGDVCNYTKYVYIPAEWEGESVGIKFDGVMMHSTLEINGSKVGEHHYGYSPFYIDITDYVTYGKENRFTINVNTGVQPSSRWYTGSGLFRSVSLCHGPKTHIANDGIYVYTKEVADNVAFLDALIDVANDSLENLIVEVKVSLTFDGDDREAALVKRNIQVGPRTVETARLAINLNNPKLWDIDSPNLYKVKATVTTKGEYRTHLIRKEVNITDEASTLFGVRTITADALRGLRINGKTVKLKGGCVHHDNGLLGSVSLYESEARKVRKLKEIGFNAIRTAHNPPSLALIEACDREGLYVFDEAFDAWGMAKRPGDYSMFFKSCWEEDITAFVKRDRVHPSVIMWSTGNEIPERGGLNNGYSLATKLANKIKELDASRPVSNGICSMWSGLDDEMAKGQNQSQNASNEECYDLWENGTEPFTNGLDIVGYNYMEDLYERNHEMFPERVMLGSENFPKEIGFRWPVVEKLPYVIGDFTWTAWDYIGEAGIGKSRYIDPDDTNVSKDPWSLMPPTSSPYPWRLANDADVDINGNIRPQGAYRSVVWGSKRTHLFSVHPKNFGKYEVIGMWGFTDVHKNWNYSDYAGKPIEVCVFSNADEVEIILNGKSIERKKVSFERPLPNSVRFSLDFEPGIIEAVSYKAGVEVSRDKLMTTKSPKKIVLKPEKNKLLANGHDVAYVAIEILDEDGLLVSDAGCSLEASFSGTGVLAGFGSSNPVTDEIYSENTTCTFNGKAMAVIRSGYDTGTAVLTVKNEIIGEVTVSIDIE